jgi:hypothetical protein
MRDKILKYLSLTGFDVNQQIEQAVQMFRMGLEQSAKFEEGDAMTDVDRRRLEEACQAVRKAFELRREDLLNEVVSSCEKFLPESVLDAACAFHESAAGRHVAKVSGHLLESVLKSCDEWSTLSLKFAEDDLSRIFLA